MRLEDAGPRTWLLAALAGWALLAGVLALAGMGGRLRPLADAPDLLQPTPPIRPAPPLRLGPIEQYRPIAERPLFATDRKPHPFFLQGQGEAAENDAFDYVLTSVLLTPQLKMAILQPVDGGGQPGDSVRVRLDEAPVSHPAWRLIGLSERSAVFAGPEGERTLRLRIFNGVGGAPPTVVSSSNRADADAGTQTRSRIPIAPPKSDPAPTRELPAPQSQSDTRAEVEREQGADTPDPVDAEPSPPMTEEAQMEAIRERIQARRQQLRRDATQKPPTPNR